MLSKLRNYMQQRRYTSKHRELERSDGFRLMQLTDHPVPTYNGYRPWCDTVLRDCMVPGCHECCDCTHTERAPQHNAQ